MLLPKLNSLGGSRTAVTGFAGYRHTDAPAENAFYNMQNVSAANCPALVPRAPRSCVARLTAPGGLAAKTALAWAENGQLYYDGNPVANLSLGEKQFVSMGAWLVVWPDKLRYNTADGTVEKLEQTNTATRLTVTPCTADGTDITPTVAPTAPEPAAVNSWWVDTAQTPPLLKRYTAEGKWEAEPTAYCALRAAGIGTGLAKGDAVTVEGVAEGINGSCILQAAAQDCLIIAALAEQAIIVTGSATVSRNLPQLDYITECNNRLWGCCSADNTVYASALGDPTNWYCYAGLDTDSYALVVGSDGPFTGCATHQGYVLFFKENCIHKLYGSKPSNFQLSVTHCRGVQPGSAKSLCTANETLYYKSDHDICAYDGSLPQSVSAALGHTAYKNAVAGAADGCLYISMQDEAQAWHLFCLDTATGTWCREDDAHAMGFAACGGVLYMMVQDGGLWRLAGRRDGLGTETAEADAALQTDGPVSWYAETGLLNATNPDATYDGQLQVQLLLPAGSSFGVEAQYDDGPWQPLANLTATLNQSLCLPVVLRRCYHYKLRFSGCGPCRLQGLWRRRRTGGEVKPNG